MMKMRGLFVFLILLFTADTSFSQSSTELKRRREKLSREIESLKKTQAKIAGNKRLSLKQINALNAQISLREEKITTINSEVRLLNSQITEKTNTVHTLQGELSKLKKEYAAMIRFAFRNQNAYGKLMFIFASKSFNQAYMRLKYFQQFSDYRKRQAGYIKETQQDLGMKIVELDQNKRSKNNLLHTQEDEKVVLSKEKIQEAEELKKLSSQERQVQKEVASKRNEVQRLNRTINAAIAREIENERRKALAAAKIAAAKAVAAKKAAAAKAASSKTSSATKNPVADKPAPKATSVLASTPEAAKLSSNFLSNRGRLPWPASGRIVARFGTNKLGNVTIENNGIDIKTSEGAGVQSIFSGEVREVIHDISGYLIIIRHGEYLSVYTNLKSASVSKGEKVSVRQHIGTVITDSFDGTTQLHLEIWKNKSPTNPESWLERH